MIAVEQRKGNPSLDCEGETLKISRPNAVTLAAVREARDIMSGKIKVDWNRPHATKEELKAQLQDMAQ